ncbi:MAG: 4'-phosphopantetheinyl transferase superfamily protein [Candidatus Bostrichicola ureolyticus]|nr:MAG: 4'-phosphopantetheinyl transferase superfamily protein [Candidatus Bostrichicola ureolyticus]
MPIIKIIEKNKHTKLIIWELIESENYLIKYLNPFFQKKKFTCIKHIKRRYEFLAIRCCLKYLGLDTIVYYLNGKPYIKNYKFNVSFSHSYNKVVVATSNNIIGVDIEKCQINKILKVKNKFLRKDEANFIDYSIEVDQLHIIWGIKESLYKLSNKKLVNFLLNYKISPFSIKDPYIICWIIDKSYCKAFIAFYLKIDNYYLVYVIDDLI